MPTRCSPGATRSVVANDGVTAPSIAQARLCFPVSIVAAGALSGGGLYFGSASRDVATQAKSKAALSALAVLNGRTGFMCALTLALGGGALPPNIVWLFGRPLERVVRLASHRLQTLTAAS